MASEGIVDLRKLLEDQTSGLMERVVAFLKENPNPTDEDFHEWAEEEGIAVEEAEEIAYVLASRMANFLLGGKANSQNLTPEDVDEAELQAGVEVEKEHVEDLEMAKRIALDHLAEIPDYYTRLHEMEAKASKSRGPSES